MQMTPLEIIHQHTQYADKSKSNGNNLGSEAVSFSLRKTLLLHTRFKQAMIQIAELHR